MSKSEELLRLEQALLAQQKTAPAEEGEGGDDGGEEGGGTSGKGGIVIEMQFFVEMFGLIRNGEKLFGPTNEFDPLAYLAKSEPNLKGELGQNQTNRLKNHPILSQLSKFDGDTPNMSMDPNQNPQAQDRYENKLQLQMAMKNRPQMTPKPGAM